MFVQFSSNQSQSVWHTHAQQLNWNQPQQWNHNNVHPQHAWYGQQPSYQPSWGVNQQQPMQQYQNQQPATQQQYDYNQQVYQYHQQPAQNWNSNYTSPSHPSLNKNAETVPDQPSGLTLVVPRSKREHEEVVTTKNGNKETDEEKSRKSVHSNASFSNQNKQPMQTSEAPQIQAGERGIEQAVVPKSSGDSVINMADEELLERNVFMNQHIPTMHPPKSQQIHPRQRGFEKADIQQKNEDENGRDSNITTNSSVICLIGHNKKEENTEIEGSDLETETLDSEIKTTHGKDNPAGLARQRSNTSRSSFVGSKERVKNNDAARLEGNAWESTKADTNGNRIKWSIIKQVCAIVLIILDVIFDWLEYEEMSNQAEWSSDRSDIVSCSARGDHIASLFLVSTILGTLFAIFQIINLAYQIYNETKNNKAAKKLMDGRTEVVITRLMEEIPQLLLIIAFRSECKISCDSENSYKDVKSALSATASICSSIWRYLISLPECSTDGSDKKKKGCCSLDDCLWGLLSCCCPCITCLCDFTIPFFPCGKVFENKRCKCKCTDWGCQSNFLLCIIRCYPSHLKPPEKEWFECLPSNSEELNWLTKIFTKPLSVVHIFSYVIYVLNLFCKFDFMFGLDKLTDILFQK